MTQHRKTPSIVQAALGLRTYGVPTIHPPDGIWKVENGGFDAFLPLIDSGISLYVWESKRFFAAVLFACKALSEGTAVEYPGNFLSVTELG